MTDPVDGLKGSARTPGSLGCLASFGQKREAQPSYGGVENDFGNYAYVHHRGKDAFGAYAHIHEDGTGATCESGSGVGGNCADDE